MIGARDIGKSLPEIWSGLPSRCFSSSLFDDLPLLDDFNRANEDPISQAGGWHTLTIGLGETTTLEVASNQLTQLDAPTSTARSFRRDALGPHCAACLTLATLPADADDSLEILLRWGPAPGSTTANGYFFRIFPAAGSNQWELHRFEADAASTSLATVTKSISTGDKFGAACIGNLIQSWHFTSSAWVNVISVRDDTYFRGGLLGVGQRDTEAKLDDLRGGSLWPSDGKWWVSP